MSNPRSLRRALEDLIGQKVEIVLDGRTLVGTVAAVQDGILVLCVRGGLCFVNIDDIQAVCTVHHDRHHHHDLNAIARLSD